MIPLIVQRYMNSRQARRDLVSGILLPYQIKHHFQYGNTPQDTREDINQLIPTFEEIDNVKDSYLAEQAVQELAAHVFMFSIPAPIKLGMEIYSFYDYFMND
jgi:hypothetical protein